MANTSGGYIVLGIDEDKNVETGYFIGFKKKGFDEGKEPSVETSLNNAIINVEPNPKVHFKHIIDDGKFHPVIKLSAKSVNLCHEI